MGDHQGREAGGGTCLASLRTGPGGSVAALEGAGGGAKVDVTGDGPGDGVTRSPWTVGRLA